MRKLDISKLNETLSDLRNKNRELRFSIANNQLKNVRELRVVKKDIAKILTVLNEKRQTAEEKVEEVKNDLSEQNKGEEKK